MLVLLWLNLSDLCGHAILLCRASPKLQLQYIPNDLAGEIPLALSVESISLSYPARRSPSFPLSLILSSSSSSPSLLAGDRIPFGPPVLPSIPLVGLQPHSLTRMAGDSSLHKASASASFSSLFLFFFVVVVPGNFPNDLQSVSRKNEGHAPNRTALSLSLSLSVFWAFL